MLKSDLKTHRLRREHLIVFFLSIQIGLNAQSSLSSCYRMDFIPQIESYYNSLDSIFQTRLGDDYLFRFTVLPSFEPEYAMQIELVEKQYYLRAISFNKNFWYAKSIADIHMDECFIELETQTAEKVLLLSKHFIENRIDSISIGPTEDSDLYLFETKENGMIACGQIWGPIPDCPLKQMCRLCTYYKDWCLTENKSKMIKSEINKLAIMLNTK